MYNKKNVIIIVGFIGIFAVLNYATIIGSSENLNKGVVKSTKIPELSTFEQIHYFKTVDEKPSFELEAKSLKITNGDLMDFKAPTGFLLASNKKISYEADQGFLNQGRQMLFLEGNVKLVDNLSNYSSDKLNYDGKREVIHAKGSVVSKIIDMKSKDTIKVKGEKLISYLKKEHVSIEGQVEGKIVRSRRYESGYDFSTEFMVYKGLKSRLELVKSVKLYRNKHYLTAGRAEIFLENYNKKLKYYTLYDDVKLEETFELESGKKQFRRAYGEKLEGQQSTGKIILTGAPRVEQGGDIIKGYQITLRESVDLVEVDDSQSNFSLKKDKK